MALNLEMALLIDFVSGTICVIAFLVSSLQQYRLYRTYPFQSLRFFSWGFFLPTLPILNVTIIIFFRILGFEIIFHDILLLIYKIAFAFGVLGIGTFAVGLWNLHPREPTRKWSSTLLGIGGLVGIAVGAIFLTLDYYWFDETSLPPVLPTDFRYGAIYIEYDSLVIIGLVALIALVVFIATRYIRDLREIQRLQTNPTKIETRWLPVAYFSLSIAFITLLLQRTPIFEDFQLALTFTIPLAIAGITFSNAFRKYPSLLAITSARLSVLTIVNPNGMALYSYDFENKRASFDDHLPVLLGGMLSALNISLSETLQSKEGLTFIAFGDKVVIIHSTTTFILYLVVSELNPTISDLINIYVKRFEEHFAEKLAKKTAIIAFDQYTYFTVVVEELIQFSPLSF
ncbi:MAG: hypothetical protein ACW964_11745 [Candidatus Hodarchaeales archaeon]|jgi:hypothetical protein